MLVKIPFSSFRLLKLSQLQILFSFPSSHTSFMARGYRIALNHCFFPLFFFFLFFFSIFFFNFQAYPFELLNQLEGMSALCYNFDSNFISLSLDSVYFNSPNLILQPRIVGLGIVKFHSFDDMAGFIFVQFNLINLKLY